MNKLKNELFGDLVEFEGNVKAQISLSIQQNSSKIKDNFKAKIKSWGWPVKHSLPSGKSRCD